jgi:hypothetical protein
MGLSLSNDQHTQEGFTFSHTPKAILKEPKEEEKENQQEKIEINKIEKITENIK